MKSLLVVNKTQLCEIWRFKTACLSLVRRCSAAAHCTAAPVKHGCCVQENKVSQEQGMCSSPLLSKAKRTSGRMWVKERPPLQVLRSYGPKLERMQMKQQIPIKYLSSQGRQQSLKKMKIKWEAGAVTLHSSSPKLCSI